MSIHKLREGGFSGITMRYEDGGAVQVYAWDNKEVRLPGSAMASEVAEALRKAEREANASPSVG